MIRKSTHGFALLTTLATILLLATLVLTLQTRSQSNLRLLARLTTDLQDQAAKDSLHDRLRGFIADTMSAAANPGAFTDGRPTLDGTPFAMREGGKDWVVRVQDVGGQVDLTLAPTSIPPDVEARDKARYAFGEDICARMKGWG